MSFYCIARFICLFMFRLYFKIEVKGLNNIKNIKTGAVMISNHKSNLDPIFLGLFLKRRLFFMAKKELFCIPILKSIIKKLGAFPVDRGSDGDEALKKAIEIVKSEGIVAIFPQGHRCKQIEDKTPKTGFIRIALKQGVVVIPCSLYYKKFFPRSRVYISYGEPINISELIVEKGLNCDNITFQEIKKLTFNLWRVVINMHKNQHDKMEYVT